jgi:hypothetical protein
MWAHGDSSIGIGIGIGIGTADDAARACMIGRDRVASCVLPLHARHGDGHRWTDRCTTARSTDESIIESEPDLDVQPAIMPYVARTVVPATQLRRVVFIKSGYSLS